MAATGRALERIWAQVLGDPRQALESQLPPTDLQTLLMAISRSRAGSRTAGDLMRRWQEDRYVHPSTVDPRAVARVEGRLWESLPEAFAGVELSPVVPLGTCSAVASVDQNRVLSTVRGTEVVSDLTNALAIEAAWRRRDTGAAVVHLAASHRVLRMQRFAPRTPSTSGSSHSSRPGGTPAGVAPKLNCSSTTCASGQVSFRRSRHAASSESSCRPTTPCRCANGCRTPCCQPCSPYQQVSPCLTASHANRAAATTPPQRSDLATSGSTPVELGDGGLTSWTAQLLADAKERCLISCVSTERLSALA
jgi:hypothetical protein